MGQIDDFLPGTVFDFMTVRILYSFSDGVRILYKCFGGGVDFGFVKVAVSVGV